MRKNIGKHTPALLLVSFGSSGAMLVKKHERYAHFNTFIPVFLFNNPSRSMKKCVRRRKQRRPATTRAPAPMKVARTLRQMFLGTSNVLVSCCQSFLIHILARYR